VQSVRRMDKDGDSSGACQCMSDLLGDDAGFADTSDDDLALTTRDQVNS